MQIYNRLMAVFLILIIGGCEEDSSTFSVISGQIENPPAEFISLLKDREVIDTLTLNRDGFFRDTLKDVNGYFYIHDRKNLIPFYLIRGTNLEISYDANNTSSSVIYIGNEPKESEFLWLKEELKKEILGDNRSTFNISEKKFKENAIALKDSLLGKLSDFSLSKDFKKDQQKYVYFDYLSNLLSYSKNQVFFRENYIPSNGFLDELQEVKFKSGKDFLTSSSYKALASSHYQKLAQKESRGENSFGEFDLLKVAAAIKNDTIRNIISYEHMRRAMGMTSQADSLYNFYLTLKPKEKERKKIEEIYNKIKRLDKGNPAPYFYNYINFSGGTTSLKDLRGKFVYIDLWATWCKPCLAEIPYLKELEKKYKDENIYFVSISVDNEKDFLKWEKMVEDKQLGGFQLFANSKVSNILEDYVVNGIPRFILIDPEGKIVSNKAPRPSDPELKVLLEDLHI